MTNEKSITLDNVRKIFLNTLLIIILSLNFTLLSAKESPDDVKSEITEALKIWNTACKNANTLQLLSLFDNSENIMVIGSAHGEISKGKEEIKAWISQIFGFAGFSWEMNRIDIEDYGKTAWVFVEGKMIVDFHKGGQKITPYRFTGVLVKKKGEWKWRLFDGSVPQQE